MTDQDRILQLLKMSGPTLPSKVAKTLNTQILLASAHLSDLSSQGKLKVSDLKVGGSPLYYLPGQEALLYPFAAGNINPKDLQVLDHLKNDKILREATLDLLSKVSIRSLKDFAIPLHVTFQGRTELFWKWHQVTLEESNRIISQLLMGNQQQEALLIPSEPIKPAEELKREEQKTLTLPIEPEKKEEAVKTPEKIKSVKPKRMPVEDTFLPDIEHFCSKLKIEVVQKETLRKNAELNLIVKVPSVVGSMTYFCKAKNKSKCDEKDLSTAYMEAQVKKLPLLFLYTEELNKKAQEMLESGAFENAVIRKLR